MQVVSQPNKYKIFQDYYFYANGEMISYSEALRLYDQLDDDTRLDFEKFYKDETGYEIISSTGYGLDSAPELKVDENGKLIVKSTKTSSKKKSVKTKKDGKIVWTKAKKTVNTYETTSSASKIAALDIKYSIEAYAKKSGKILDPKWAGYSAEEIMQMFNDGVNIPQDVVDLANSILQTSGANVEGTDENPDGAEETTEKEPYLDLIPKAKKKIEKCNDTNEKISNKIDDLIPEQQKREKSFKEKVENQKKSLDEFEKQLREWRRLQDKVNNGEALSDSEAKKYAQITGMLEDKNNKDDMQFDKNEIARSLNDINILAVLGEKLADETIEIGDTLADYTSKANYKATAKTVSHEIGFIGTIMAMAQGKNLAKEANKVGNDTKEYSEDTTHSVGDIAEILGVQNSVLSSSELKAADGTQAPEPITQEADTPASDKPVGTVENENEDNNAAKEEVKTPETTAEEDFIVNDKNVQELIKEGGHIHSDMAGQTVRALRNSIDAKSDEKFAKYANYKITRIIKRYQDAEEKREEEIAKLEQENKEAKDKLEKLTGKSGDELDKEINNTSGKKEDENTNLSESDKKEVENLKAGIQSNNQRIAELKETAQTSIDDFKNKTVKEKSRISTAVPKENQELEANTEYQEKIIPQAKEDLSFTDNSGATLAKMGKYRVTVGLQQIAMMQFKKGYKNLAKGAVSVGIGLGAQIVGSLPTPQLAEKATTSAIKNETSAIEGLNQADAMISSITGEETTQSSYDSNKQAEQDQTAGNAEDGAKDTADGINITASAPEVTPSAQVEQAPQQETPAVVAPQNTDGITTGAAVPVLENGSGAGAENKVKENATVDVEKATTKATVDISDGKKETPEEKEENKNIKAASDATTSSSSNKNSNKKEEMTTDKAGDTVKKAEKTAKDDAKDSEKVKKDEEKTTKQLEKETKRLTKKMKKDEKDIIKMTKESQKAAKKQEEMVVEFEALVAENEQLAAEDENKKQNAQPQQAPAQQAAQQGAVATAAPAATMGGTQPQQTDNQSKIQNNDARLNQIGAEFTTNGRIITRNTTKIKRLQKTTKATQKKVTKKTKTINQKNKEAEKKEIAKQKRLAKQLAAVGIAENVFSITLATGTILAAIPWSHAVGVIMVNIGTKGVLYCGVTKAAINFANGNVTAGLMAIGQTVLTVAMSTTGVGGAASGVLAQVSAGLNVVASSADLVNNVRAVQGKEASGVFSKISAIAGTASAITSAASTLSNLGQTASTFGKVAKVGSVVGSALSSTSQLMSSFGGDSKTASLLGAIGGAISMAASVGMLADSKMAQAKEKNQANKDSQANEAVKETNETSPEQQKQEAEQKQAEKKAQVEVQKEQQKVKTEADKKVAEAKEIQKQEKTEQTKKDEKPSLKESKEAKAAKKEEAKDSGLSSAEKKNMTKNGASKEYADVSDDQLEQNLEFARETGDDALADKLAAEMTKRGDYKEKMAVISENKAETISKIKEGIGQGMQVASSIMNMGSSNNGQQKKKGTAPAGKLTKRSKEIMNKRKKRIAALAKKRKVA